MKEKDLEMYLVGNPDIIEDGLTLIGRQQRVAGKLVDILFESKLGEVVVVEVKQVATRKDIAQLFDYAGYFIERSQKLVRVILVAFKIPKNFKNTFDIFGVEYAEISEDQVVQSLKRSDTEVVVDPIAARTETYLGEEGERNLTRKAMAKRLRSGHLFQQAAHVMRLLKGSEHGLTMNEIVQYMKKNGYKSRSYYDLCNALTDAGLIIKGKSGSAHTYSASGE